MAVGASSLGSFSSRFTELVGETPSAYRARRPGPGISDADRAALSELLAKGHLGFYLFTTDDVDGLYERLVEGGADIVSEPADQPWGPRDMAVRDPSGNLLRINQG